MATLKMVFRNGKLVFLVASLWLEAKKAIKIECLV